MYPPALIRREAAQVPRLLRSLSKEEIAGKRVIGIYHKCDDYDIAFRCWWGDEYIQFYLDLMVIEFGALGSSGEEAITSLRDTEVNTLFSRHLQGINPQLLSFKNGFIYYTE